MSEYKGKRVKGVEGKEPPSLDFVIEKNKLVYGADIKNWIKYEFDTISAVIDKVDLTLQLGIIPFVCARYADKDTFYEVVQIPGIVYRYKTLVLPPEFGSLAHEANNLLGYPILADYVPPAYKLDFMSKMHEGCLNVCGKENDDYKTFFCGKEPFLGVQFGKEVDSCVYPMNTNNRMLFKISPA